MQSNYYTILGLDPSATLPAIRAVYNVLVLEHHPDRTANLTEDERTTHASIFHSVQEAYNVLGNPALKETYDKELQNFASANVGLSTSHCARSTRSDHARPFPANSTAAHPPTEGEKTTMKSRVEAQMTIFRLERARRDEVDKLRSVAHLKHVLELWMDQMAVDNLPPHERAYCQIKIHEYEQKIAERKGQHEAWLKEMSTPKARQEKTPNQSSRPYKYTLFSGPSRSPSTSSSSRTASPMSDAGTTSTRARARANAKDNQDALRNARATTASTARRSTTVSSSANPEDRPLKYRLFR
ncbi:hypothetical protein BU24DRAFT_456037 [Aaosphaeria arxii CBS 175.79]|uniref:J domain-containing protein n=1 Tax=Aaosphaeria arxii CBS 175.79 TaxID=1450172 RepID=A0A6A5X6Y5_9PLEO|nr:uncharacterized protein BU24DRAFT_456037 [Aaosphaeria arxii CBS 175.79]KAF2008775.1 hypothetical protein BU24DRAFT_456037 [Aaosphaeria arxii CBS 175.79]